MSEILVNNPDSADALLDMSNILRDTRLVLQQRRVIFESSGVVGFAGGGLAAAPPA
jgi:hypothetical protein